MTICLAYTERRVSRLDKLYFFRIYCITLERNTGMSTVASLQVRFSAARERGSFGCITEVSSIAAVL
jgi:hypothetical protein